MITNTVAYRFVTVDDEVFSCDAADPEPMIRDIWQSKIKGEDLPIQLVSELDGSVILRFVESMPEPYRDHYDALADVCAICARFEKDHWNLLWVVPIRTIDGPYGGVGELLIWGERIPIRDMAEFK